MISIEAKKAYYNISSHSGVLHLAKSCPLTTQPGRQANNSKAHLLLLLIPATTFGLGTWQIYRLQWKLGLIKDLEERTTCPPMEMPEKFVSICGNL